MYQELKAELRSFYGADGGHVCIDQERLAHTAELTAMMNEYAASNPGKDRWCYRKELYEVHAGNYRPVIFPHSPYYGITGGNGGWNRSGAGEWLLKYNWDLFIEASPENWELFRARVASKFYHCGGPYFDNGHNSPPIANIVAHGLRHYYEKALAILPQCENDDERGFVEAAAAGLLALKKIAATYAEKARAIAMESNDPDVEKCMARIIESAVCVPWEAPRTFYEGLNTLWFVREVIADLDGLKSNSLGRMDCWLEKLYLADLEAGRLTYGEAYDLVCRFLLMGDMIYDHDSPVVVHNDHENEISFTLGGCDTQGCPVFNELTRMILEAHRNLNCIYPKPHCRFSADSPKEYLQFIAADIMAGRGVYSLVNDDSIIPALVKDGKTLEDARDYCCTGCWDIVVDSREDNAGGNYFNLARILEATIHDSDERHQEFQLRFRRLDGAESFQDVYDILLGNVMEMLSYMLDIEGSLGKLWGRYSPDPLTSACASDCLEKRKDFSSGGHRYNPHAVSLCFFGTFVDSLLAIKTLCFDHKICSLPELLNAVRANWQGFEVLRQQVLGAPHWGDNKPETVAMANRVFEEIHAKTRKFENERGGRFQLGIWCYREFRFWGELTKATPDGRHDSDLLSQSLNPSHFRNLEDIATVLGCLASLDSDKLAGNSVINLLLDKNGLSVEVAEALLRTFAQLKLQLLQLNCSSREELLDAQKHPEAHTNLIVRLCGFSAKFTALSPEWQQEVINRKEYS